MVFRTLRFAAAAALACTAMSAQAGPVSIQVGFAHGSVNMTVGATNAGGSVTASVGAFKGLTGASSPYNTSAFITYCVELTQYLSLNTQHDNYTLMDGAVYFGGITRGFAAGSAVVVERLVNLFSFLGGIKAPTSTTQSAAIQLAVWESIYEGNTAFGSVGGNVSGIGAGTFAATNNGTTLAAIDAANVILAGARNFTGLGLFSIQVLSSSANQDLLVLTQLPDVGRVIPEPATLALTLTALLGVGVVTRRRRNA